MSHANGNCTHLVTAEWFLRNTPTSGIADDDFTYGSPGDLPIVGDWGGDSTDTIGIARGPAVAR